MDGDGTVPCESAMVIFLPTALILLQNLVSDPYLRLVDMHFRPDKRSIYFLSTAGPTEEFQP